MSIADNVAAVRERITAAARRSGRSVDEITLMAVSKTFPPTSIREAYAAGIRMFGENRVQEFSEKLAAVRDLQHADWHLIGHLQTNKVSRAVELFRAIDSIDSLKLGDKVDRAAEPLRKKLEVLVEINVGGEQAKTGLKPGCPELDEILVTASEWKCLRVRGLMTVPPYFEDPELARPYFRQLRTLRDEIASRDLAGVDMDVLSMGMSHDFEVAIEEGSTCVRVGTAIFGGRPMSPPASPQG
jgi:pyridoxal phosphate enzyme (YggS family)